MAGEAIFTCMFVYVLFEPRTKLTPQKFRDWYLAEKLSASGVKNVFSYRFGSSIICA
jgi:hypothetical protein